MSDSSARRSRTILRVIVFLTLGMSVVGAFLMGDSLWRAAQLGDIPTWAPLIAPITFTLFVVVFAVERFRLVKKRKLPLGRAVFQLAFAAIFLSILWPDQANQLRMTREAQDGDPTVQLLRHTNPHVRAAVCELLGYRNATDSLEKIQQLARSDRSDHVRKRCAQAASQLQK